MSSTWLVSSATYALAELKTTTPPLADIPGKLMSPSAAWKRRSSVFEIRSQRTRPLAVETRTCSAPADIAAYPQGNRPSEEVASSSVAMSRTTTRHAEDEGAGLSKATNRPSDDSWGE